MCFNNIYTFIQEHEEVIYLLLIKHHIPKEVITMHMMRCYLLGYVRIR